jgi:catechol 2,3-dioxygenase-like lactoylglutathione lyase family enzyme
MVEASLIAPALRVADAARVAAFYESVLSMRVLMSRDLGPIHETMLAFASDPARPAIMLLSNAATASTPMTGIGGSRLILRVARLDAVVARLDAAGIPHQPASPAHDGVTVLQIADPEHNELELVQMPARQ